MNTRELFEEFANSYDLESDEWEDLGRDEIFAAGFKAALSQKEKAEPVAYAVKNLIDKKWDGRTIYSLSEADGMSPDALIPLYMSANIPDDPDMVVIL